MDVKKIGAAYQSLIKFRLSISVVFSAVFAYLYASRVYAQSINWENFTYFTFGMFLVVTSSNIYNQIIEYKYDKLMKRTLKRPIVSGFFSKIKAYKIMIISLILGLSLLYIGGSLFVMILAFFSWTLYVWAYTPLKRKHPIAVWVGAIPGALPPLLGYLAISQKITKFAILIFLIQFIWQIPHFWAIAWVNYKDYKRAGFFLLPSKNKDQTTVSLIFFSILILVLSTTGLNYYNMVNIYGFILIHLLNFIFLLLGFRFLKLQKENFIKQIMFYSFIYLPFFQIILLGFYK